MALELFELLHYYTDSSLESLHSFVFISFISTTDGFLSVAQFKALFWPSRVLLLIIGWAIKSSSVRSFSDGNLNLFKFIDQGFFVRALAEILRSYCLFENYSWPFFGVRHECFSLLAISPKTTGVKFLESGNENCNEYATRIGCTIKISLSITNNEKSILKYC